MKRAILFTTILLMLIFSFVLSKTVTAQGSSLPQCTNSGECGTDQICAYNDILKYSVCQDIADLPNVAVFGKINPPSAIKTFGIGSFGINKFLDMSVNLIFIVAAVAFVIMVVVSALQWILSGGNKETVAGAQKRLTWAVIGMVILSVAVAIINVFGVFTGFKFFGG